MWWSDDTRKRAPQMRGTCSAARFGQAIARSVSTVAARQQAWGKRMGKILELYYSSWGHMEAMAIAAGEGARSTGATVDIKRVPELVPLDVAKAAYYKLD